MLAAREQVDQLPDVERISPGLAEIPDQVGSGIATEMQANDGGHLFGVQRSEFDRPCMRLRGEHRQRRPFRHPAVGEDHRERESSRDRTDPVQQSQGLSVGEMRVVDDEHDRSVCVDRIEIVDVVSEDFHVGCRTGTHKEETTDYGKR